MFQDQLGMENHQDDNTAAVDWIKRENDVYETEDLIVEEQLEIGPTVLQPCHPVITPKVNEEAASGDLKMKSIEEQASAASGVKPSTKRTPHVCGVCNKDFRCLSKLRRHMCSTRVHTGKQPFSCTFCKTKFTQKCHLKYHMYMHHTVVRPHKCSSCDEKFLDFNDLKLHKTLVHARKLPFSCKMCLAKFSHLEKLNTHICAHTTQTGERRFGCTFCDEKFDQLQNLQTHIRVHEQTDYNCGICDAKFSNPNDLKLHIMSIHPGDRPFRCTTCNAKFTYQSHLKTHIMFKHSGEPSFSFTTCKEKFIQSSSY